MYCNTTTQHIDMLTDSLSYKVSFIFIEFYEIYCKYNYTCVVCRIHNVNSCVCATIYIILCYIYRTLFNYASIMVVFRSLSRANMRDKHARGKTHTEE